mmetsp:Transcript_82946/g.160291  ORF Transcript_82946/g.160291 Transcript_82946/m.160291 type:complete len:109 (-) Transcript_82946:923-1249(-)
MYKCTQTHNKAASSSRSDGGGSSSNSNAHPTSVDTDSKVVEVAPPSQVNPAGVGVPCCNSPQVVERAVGDNDLWAGLLPAPAIPPGVVAHTTRLRVLRLVAEMCTCFP